MTWTSKSLRYGGTCIGCGVVIEPRQVGWHDPALKKVRCVSCGPGTEASSTDELSSPPLSDLPPPPMNFDPVGGSAALRESRSRHDPNWAKGAAGEYLMDLTLHKHVNPEAIILTDRGVPGTKSNIDHIVIASSGVWIIDAKTWSGRIEFKGSSRFAVNERLYVNGRDRTSEVEAIFKLVIPVAQIIGDRSVPIVPALVFIDGDWTSLPTWRIAASRPYQHMSVWISWPKGILSRINAPGPLGPESIARIGSQLNEQLRPR